MTYHIVIFGCASNTADAERLASYYESQGLQKAESIDTAHVIVLVTCMVRQSAEDRVYGLVRNLTKEKAKGRSVKIVVTGCMTGMATRDPSGNVLSQLRKKMPGVDEFLPIAEVGFDYPQLRSAGTHALVPISNGCNNFCTFCIVPFTRGREVSRVYESIIEECTKLAHTGTTSITLVGQNVNSYGSDLVADTKNEGQPVMVNGKAVMPVYVKHLGRLRIPTLFPSLVADVAEIPGITEVDFISSNPWDFSDELINVIATHKNVKRVIHLPIQSGDEQILKRMNRWYTPDEYIALVEKIRASVPDIRFSTDIIVWFPGETNEQFDHTVEVAKRVGFGKAYVAMYSIRPGTAATKTMIDDIPYEEKKRRWEMLDELINKSNLKKGTYPKTDSVQKTKK